MSTAHHTNTVAVDASGERNGRIEVDRFATEGDEVFIEVFDESGDGTEPIQAVAVLDRESLTALVDSLTEALAGMTS